MKIKSGVYLKMTGWLSLARGEENCSEESYVGGNGSLVAAHTFKQVVMRTANWAAVSACLVV